MNTNNTNNNDGAAEQILIENLRKQLNIKQNQYNTMIYKATILRVADTIFKLNKEDVLDISYLPALF